MDLRLTRQELEFRTTVRNFIKQSLPEGIRRRMLARRHLSRQDIAEWQRILNAKGWAVPAWPVAYGGTGWTPIQRYIFLEELHQAPAPEPLSFNTGMIGPVLIAFGSDRQKSRFLPRIANLDDWWCQGFSEPGAGSDLAALTTSARLEGGHYVVNGQKAWTTMAHVADWMFCLVRTDPNAKKQHGITMLLIDMKSPGITVRPIITIDGDHETNEVFLDDVRVPAENRVGEENMGWTYTKFLLGNERAGIARVGVSWERIRRIKFLAQRIVVDGRSLSESPDFMRKVADLEVDIKALEITQMRVVSAQAVHDGRPDPFTSILKIRGSELQQATMELLADMLGPLTLADNESGTASEDMQHWASSAVPGYLFARAYSIFGGSNEIQKNILAKAVLEL